MFYVTDPSLHFLTDEFNNIPEHAQPISDEDWKKWLEKQSEGLSLVLDEEGQITTEDRRVELTKSKILPPTSVFFDFLTEKESDALGEASLTNAKLFMWVTKLSAKSKIEPQSDNFVSGLDLLIKEKILAKSRKAELLKYLE